MPLSVPPNNLYLSRKSSPSGFITESLLFVTTFSGGMNNRWPCGGTDSLATSTCLTLPGGFRDLYPMVWDFPGGLVCKESTCNAGDGGVVDLIPGMGRSPGRRAWQPSPVFMPGGSYGQRSLEATVHRVAKNQIRLEWLCMHAYIS